MESFGCHWPRWSTLSPSNLQRHDESCDISGGDRTSMHLETADSGMCAGQKKTATSLLYRTKNN